MHDVYVTAAVIGSLIAAGFFLWLYSSGGDHE